MLAQWTYTYSQQFSLHRIVEVVYFYSICNICQVNNNAVISFGYNWNPYEVLVECLYAFVCLCDWINIEFYMMCKAFAPKRWSFCFYFWEKARERQISMLITSHWEIPNKMPKKSVWTRKNPNLQKMSIKRNVKPENVETQPKCVYIFRI